MESVDDWLEQEVVEGVEGEEEEEQHEEGVTPPIQATPATSRGHGLPPVAPSSLASRAQQSLLPTPSTSTTRGAKEINSIRL